MGASRRAGPRSRRRSGSLGLPAALMVALSPGACMPALQAQQSADVNFSPGKYGTMLSGSVTGREYFDHKLRARAGQKMFAELSIRRSNDSSTSSSKISSTSNGTAYFNVMPPGSTGEAIYVGSMDTDRSALVILPTNGVYTIRVYLMGNDRDSGKTVDYNLDLSIQ
jgi:hypothetical protein